MVDVKLFQSLLAALRHGCRIIMVGDADQLPSVGPGNILGCLLYTSSFSVSTGSFAVFTPHISTLP